jgi:phosphoribosylaminoimidazolecarboxamide formyltransferase/IMP cyclohydrolase
MRVRRALLSVSNKDGILEFAKGLQDLEVELIATGGTAAMLEEAGIDCTPVEEVTGFPEVLSGRVKTLHPAIMAGILARRGKDLDELSALNIKPIDLVAVNLYPFESAAREGELGSNDILEEIDIGGVCLLRAAAKNYRDVAVISSPDCYVDVLERLRENNGEIAEDLLEELAREAFHHTALYDSIIGTYFDRFTGMGSGIETLSRLNLAYRRAQALRYGENPHQPASFFEDLFPDSLSISSAEQMHGKELSYNNIMDLDSAVSLVLELTGNACVIMKHTNPCGVGIGDSPLDAYRKALSTDPVSAFGSIIAFNTPVDEAVAEEMRSLFIECIITPSFAGRAIEILEGKKSLRLLRLPGLAGSSTEPRGYAIRSVRGGVLVQERDRITWDEKGLATVTQRQATPEELRALRFAWVVCKHIKSNGIVLASADRTIGIGTGQMSRIDSVEIALMKARNAGLAVEGAVMASDAFFPFRDSIDRVAGEGVHAVVQPGGSIRDAEVIRAADEHGIAMIFTGIRHFRH